MKSIWFICKDAGPISESGIFLRTLKQAQYCQNRGYSVKIICSSWIHATTINHLDNGLYKKENHNGIDYIFLSSIPYGNSTAKRMISYVHFSFMISRLLNVIEKPDVIIHTSRIPWDVYIYRIAKRIHAKYIMDVSDLWPWEFEHMGKLKPNSLFLKLFYSIEKKLYSKADEVVFSIEGGPDYIRNKKWDKQNGGPVDMSRIHYVNTGIDLKEFNDNLENNSVEDMDLSNDKFKLIYLGAVRPANNVEAIINAAKLLTNKNIQILIYGNGPDRERLEERIKKENIDCVSFKTKWVDPKYVPYILSKSSVNILNYVRGWAPYGGSMNKMFMAIACGKPIICNAGMGYSPIRKYNIGIDKDLSDSKEYADAIMSLYNMTKEEYQDMCSRTLLAANEYDSHALCKQFFNVCGL